MYSVFHYKPGPTLVEGAADCVTLFVTHQKKRQMALELLTGIILLGISAVLLFIAWPDKNGLGPRFLRFEASMMLYPPLVLVFIALGSAAMIAGFFAH